MSTDLLLLNATNYPRRPVYPYAFVQVRAIAKQHGLRVVGHDLFGVAPEQIGPHLDRLLETHRPRAVGVHLRQADSLLLRDYHPSTSEFAYFPLRDTRWLVEQVRRRTDAKIFAGGFGFTTHAHRLYRHLGVDFGVQGEPDGMLAAFDSVLAGRDLDRVDNLLFDDGGQVASNARVFHAPLNEREYDEEVFAALESFYGQGQLHGQDPPTVAVELARGCPYRCYFCTEPTVKGRKTRVRDLDAVMADVEFLARQGVRSVWLVCSELNMGSADLARTVSERFLRFNEGRTTPVSWRAYMLPRWLGRDDLELMYRSGFMGGWNDFPALEDSVLRSCRVPYRASDLVEHAQITAELLPGGPDGRGAKIGLFLGNAFSTPNTIAQTLKRYDRDLAGRFARAEVGVGTRLFDSVVDVVGEQSVAHSQTHTGTTSSDDTRLLHPTFHIPKAIVGALGGVTEALSFFDYVEKTLLAGEHRKGRDWCRFLRRSATPEWIAARLGPEPPALPGVPDALANRLSGLWPDGTGPSPRLLAERLDPDEAGHALDNALAFILCELLRGHRSPAFEQLMAGLGVDVDPSGRTQTTPYRLLEALLASHDSEASVLRALHDIGPDDDDDGLAQWRVQRLFHEHDIRIDARFRPFLVEAA
ncbi:MAG: hypothetical protein AAF799_45570 [Myxococcota bacterium]